ncbi:DUF4179 domain-containing protein [Paraclostridium bifermentans]|uniref:DUF4179 domain-containing protein n=1 Tax=Paraclostridium bifermentans TaxID=1490 RepID=UPI00359C8F2B
MDQMKKVDKIIGGNEIPDCIDIKINEARNHIKKENRRRKIVKNTVLSFSATFVILLGLSISNPALADKIPFLGNAINTLKEDSELCEKSIFIRYINNKNAKKINEKSASNDVVITVQEATCDGSNLYISYLVESNNHKIDKAEDVLLGETINSGHIKASFSDEELEIVDTDSKKVAENTYVVVQYIDLAPLIKKGIDIKDEFKLNIHISKVRGFIEDEGEKKIWGNWNFDIDIKSSDSTNIKYKPNLENNKAVLKQVVLTPSTTEVEVDIPKEFGASAYILAYDDKGNKLEGHTFSYNKPSKIGTLEYNKFTPISKDAKYIIVKVVDKATDNLDLLSEFKLDLTDTPKNK